MTYVICDHESISQGIRRIRMHIPLSCPTIKYMLQLGWVASTTNAD